MQVSIIKKSAVVGNFRIDAECYQEKYVLTKKKLSALKNTLLGNEVSKFYKGIFDIRAENYSDSGIPFVRIGDLKDCIIDTSNIAHIPELEHLKNHKTALRKGDIILSKTAYPAASFVNLSECNTSQDTIAVRLKENSQIESEYLVVWTCPVLVGTLSVVRKETPYAIDTSTLSVRVETPDRRACACWSLSIRVGQRV